jgi:hypothetical protein
MPPAAVAGIGQTRYAKNMGRTEVDLAVEAIRAACADAGLPVDAIDGFVSYHVEQVAEVELVTTLGITDLRFMARTPSGGGGAASRPRSPCRVAPPNVSSPFGRAIDRRRRRTAPARTRAGDRGRRPAPR